MGTTVLSINPHLMPELDYDAARDLVPIANIGESISVIAVANSVPAKSLADLVALDKAKPGQLSFGTAGAGSIAHIAGEYLNQLAGTTLTHVPYRGSGPLMNDAIGGHVPVIFDSLITALPAIQADKIRPLAVLQRQSAALIPDVPTTTEAGYPDLVSTSYYGFLAPRGTPQEIVERLNTEINKILSQPEIQQRVREQGAILTGGSAESFRKLIDETTARYGEIIKKARITAN